MQVVLICAAAATVAVATYHLGAMMERRQVSRWLEFLHDEEEEVSFRQLSTSISVKQHHYLGE